MLSSVAVAMVAAIGCSSGGPGPAAAIETTSRETVTVTKHVVASVLITESVDLTDDEIESIWLSSTSVVVDRGESLVLSAEAFGAGDTALDGVEFVWAMADGRAGSITRDGEFRAGESPGVYGDAISVTGVEEGMRLLGSAGVAGRHIGQPIEQRVEER